MLIYNHQHNLNFLENNNLLLTYQVAKCNAFRRPEWHCPLTSNTYIIKAHNYITLNENQHDKCNSLLVVSKNSPVVENHHIYSTTRNFLTKHQLY